MSWVSKIESERGDQVYLVRGKDHERQAWHYVLVEKLKLSLFLKKIDGKSIDLEDYGKVLYSGWGEDPPEAIVKKIEDEYS